MLPRMKGRFFSQLYAYDDVVFAKCEQVELRSFLREMDQKLWRVDALLVASAIMAGVIVGIGAYGQRYRHHHLTRFIFLGATTLFLPIISSVVSSGTVLDSSMNPHGDHDLDKSSPSLFAVCNPAKHSVLVVTWALLVQNVMINTSVVVVVDHREGRSTGPPIELLVQGVWTLYLGISHLTKITSNYPKIHITVFYLLELSLFVLTIVKLAFKYYAVKMAQHSFAFRRNPRLVFGYMHRQLHLMPMTGEQAPPPLLVMGEETIPVEKQPQGYVFKDDTTPGTTMWHNSVCLVTIDKVWVQLDSHDNMLLQARPTRERLKDLCLSFALFKLLRCRFARYQITVSGSDNTSPNYFWSLLLKNGEPDRVFQVIADELSFLHDYYYSSLPISYSKCWLPIVGIGISLLSIGYCIFLAVWMVVISKHKYDYQIVCHIRCREASYLHLGILNFDVVPLFLLLVFVVTAEVRDMVSYICSNWTKVVLTYQLLVHNELSLSMHKWFSHLLRCRCKLVVKQWGDKLGQCSVLPLHRGRIARFVIVVRRFLHLPDHKTKINAAMKASIMDVLRSSRNGLLISHGKASFRHLGPDGENRFLWACESKGVSDIILTWQIATSILEVRYPDEHQGRSNDHRVAATHLSRYCAYLVTQWPQLLPDDDAWSKSLFKAVKKDSQQALAQSWSSSRPPEYPKLIQLLSANSKHKVVKDGVELGKQLVDLEQISDEETAWKLLDNFWSEMILYIAPSDNLKGHKESVAHGGELITLLWVLLNHAGIVSQTTSDASRSTATSSSVVVETVAES